MMYMATCRYREVASREFLGCHAGRMMCPTRCSKACDLAGYAECVKLRRSWEPKAFLSLCALSRSG